MGIFFKSITKKKWRVKGQYDYKCIFLFGIQESNIPHA